MITKNSLIFLSILFVICLNIRSICLQKTEEPDYPSDEDYIMKDYVDETTTSPRKRTTTKSYRTSGFCNSLLCLTTTKTSSTAKVNQNESINFFL